MVNWNLGNTCSLACSYCSPALRGGTQGFPDIDAAKAFVADLTNREKSRNRLIEFSFVGGEPTEWEHLADLLADISQHGHHCHLMSNGVAALETWDALVPSLSSLTLTCHAKADFLDFCTVLDVVRDLNPHIFLAMTPQAFTEQLERAQIMMENGFRTELQPLYHDHLTRRRLLDYSSEQLAILFPVGEQGLIINGDNTSELQSVNSMIRSSRNSFTGMKCAIGLDQLVVDPSGNVWGGWCRVGGTFGNINGEFMIPTEPQICSKLSCNNPLDLTVAKWEEL